MKYILVCLSVLFLYGCDSPRSESSYKQEIEKLTQLVNDQSKVTSKVNAELSDTKSDLSKSEKLRSDAREEIRHGKEALVEADELDKAHQRDDAKKWRQLFDIIGIGFTVLAIAAYALAFFQGWPIKWLATIFGALATALYLTGEFYVWIVDYRPYIVGGIVIVAIGTLYWYLHTKCSFISQTKDKIKIAEGDLKGTAKRVIKKWNIPVTQKAA